MTSPQRRGLCYNHFTGGKGKRAWGGGVDGGWGVVGGNREVWGDFDRKSP